jgi:hypothetical protein
MAGCGEQLVDVSESELWVLEMEQVDDGLEGTNPRRGTITMELRFNHTTQPDPACAGNAQPNVTTFLADVEVLPSRMALATSGSMNGSWNCHGFAATVRLNNGTTYELRSDSPSGLFTTMEDNWWNESSGARGSFLLQPAEMMEHEIRQSHFDLIADNRTDQPWRLALIKPLDLEILGLHYVYNPTSHYDSADVLQFVDVPARGSVRISWPSHENRRLGRIVTALPEFRVMNIRDAAARYLAITTCILGSDHPEQIHLLFDGLDEFGIPAACGQGWIGHVFLGVDRRPLFMQPGAEDMITVLTQEADELAVESSDPSITAQLDVGAGSEDQDVWSYPLTIRVAPGAPRREHQLTVRGLYWGEVEEFVVIPISVYELNLAPLADTIIVSPGVRDTTSLFLETEGVFGGVRFRTIDLPTGVLDVPPSFSPSVSNVTSGVGTVMTFPVSVGAPPGVYDITVCALIELDPWDTCHFTTVTLVVLETPADFSVTAEPGALQLALGGQASTTVRINRNGPGVGLVTVSLSGLPTGVPATFDMTGDVSTMTLFAAANAPSGEHELTIEASNGPLMRTATVQVNIAGGGGAACDGFGLRVDFEEVSVYPNTGDIVPVFVDREAGFTGQVELRLERSNGGSVTDVFSSWSFDPNPIQAGSGWSILNFTVQSPLDPGEEFGLIVRGASPTFEDPAAVCEVSFVAEVLE